MSTEAQKRASEKYRLTHKDYYNKKSKEYAKRVRSQKNDYKARIDKAIEYIDDIYSSLENVDRPIKMYDDLLNILQGEDNE
jgi:hypothetical protein